MKKNQEKSIPFSNYVKLFFIVAVTISLSFILRNIYISDTNYKKTIPVIRDSIVSEINRDEIYNYIRENENAVIYIGVADNDNCRKFEEEFKKVITKQNLEYRVTYLNITNEKKRTSFIKEFNKFYGTKVLGYPSLVIFEEGKVKDIITVKTNKELDINKVKEFLKRNNITFDIYD